MIERSPLAPVLRSIAEAARIREPADGCGENVAQFFRLYIHISAERLVIGVHRISGCTDSGFPVALKLVPNL